MRTPTHRRLLTCGVLGVGTALVLAGCSGGSGFGDEGGNDASGGGKLSVLIGSSGDAETKAVKDAVASWSQGSDTDASVSVAADLPQQLSQGFASGSPADVFYVATEAFPEYAGNGSLEAYGDKLDADFYPTLKESFTQDGTLYCAPKDFSTLALVVNDKAWAAAGLTEKDYPKTWADLRSVAKKLTTGPQTGLTFGPEWQRIGTFMAQAGGHLVDDKGHADVDTPENLAGLAFAKELLTSGVAKYPSDLGAGWGGEAFGTGAAAMTIEGNWIVGALKNDYPDIDYTVVPLPNGPQGAGTLQFTNCWGIAADSKNKDAAVDLVTSLVADEQQMTFAKDFGVMPSVTTVADEWKAEFPDQAAFLDGAENAQGVPPIDGITDVVADFNSQLESLKTGDPKAILASVQKSLQAVAP